MVLRLTIILGSSVALLTASEAVRLRLKTSPEKRVSERLERVPQGKHGTVRPPQAGGRLQLLTPTQWQSTMEAQAQERLAAGKHVHRIQQNAEGVAISGYDVVAYFKLGTARLGKAELAHEYQGATFQFANEQHRAAFIRDPDSYLPRFGGYCAYHVAKGEPVSSNPTVWRMISGRLYLAESRSILATWERDLSLLIPVADQNWRRMHD